MLGVLEVCSSSGTACTSSQKRISQELLRDGESALCGLLLPAWVPKNSEVVNPIKVRSFLEVNTEELTSNNAAELQAFLVLLSWCRKPISCLSAGVNLLTNLLQI